MRNFTSRLIELVPPERRPKLLTAIMERQVTFDAMRQARLALDDAINRHGAVHAQNDAILADAPSEMRVHIADEISFQEQAAADAIPRYQAALDRLTEQFQQHYFLDEVHRWLATAARLKVKLALDVLPSVGGDHASAVKKLRAKMRDLENRRDEVSDLPADMDDLLDRLDAMIEGYSATGAPSLDFSSDAAAPVALHALEEGEHSSSRLLSFVMWCFGDEIRAKLHALVKARAPGGGVGSVERSSLMASIDIDLLALAREEEAHIVAAEALGLKISRRRQIDPRAFLEVREV